MIQEGYFGCEEFLHRLPLLLDGEHDPADDRLLRSHLSWCEKCLHKYRFELGVIEAIRKRLAEIELPAGWKDRVAAMLAVAAAGGGGK
jgi:anti-sigma factor (TIGR02949 family)